MNDSEPTIPAVSRKRPSGPRSAPGRGGFPGWLWLVLGVAVVAVGLLVCGGALWIAYQQRPGLTPGAFPTPFVRTIAAPTGTAPGATPSGDVTAAPAETPTANVQATFPPPPPGALQVGAHVQVVNTGGVGLSLRQGPGQDSPRVAIAIEGELLEVTDGPRVIAGMTWWKLKRTDGIEGWGVQNFLQLTP